MNRLCYSQLTLATVLLALLSTAYAEVIHWHPCPNPDNAPLNCTIHEVRVEPCREASQGFPCRLKRGQNASISFDFTADFSGSNIESRAYWASEVVDLPFLGMDSNACAGTDCPLSAGQRQTYTKQLPISKKFPVRTYDLKWKLWNEEEQECCFMFPIKLQK